MEGTIDQQRELVERILKDVDLPEPPRVVRIAYRLRQDWTEHDAVYVWLMLADDTPRKHWAIKGYTGPIMERVCAALREGGVDRLCYVSFRSDHEQDEAARDDPPDGMFRRDLTAT